MYRDATVTLDFELHGSIMEPVQYEIMDRVEGKHWWYLGLRDLLTECWNCPELKLPEHPAVLDAGCGTGGNLRFFRDHLRPSYLGGFDNSALALQCVRSKVPEADVYEGDICRPIVHHQPLDLLFSCDVVYVPGLAASKAGLVELVSHLKPGAQFVLHLPAYNWLKSHHDRAVHTRERYVLGQVKQLMVELNLNCLRASYRLCPLLPLIVANRLPGLLIRSRRQSRDLAMPAAWLNRWLLSVIKIENRWIAQGKVMPWGSSILAIGKKTI